MKEVLRTTNAVLLSWAESVLAAEGIACFVFDRHASVAEGSIGALPCRLMVEERLRGRACRALAAARAEEGLDFDISPSL